MRGPWSFVSQEWGLVVEGFTPSPVIMAPYNPPYYIDHIASFKLEKIKDLLVYYMSVKEGYTIPDRIMTLTGDVAKRYWIHVCQVDMKNYTETYRYFNLLSDLSASVSFQSAMAGKAPYRHTVTVAPFFSFPDYSYFSLL